MTAGRLGPSFALAVLAGLAATVAGCGSGGSGHAPTLSSLPLIPGARIVRQVRQCDPGANAFCALELVVVDRRFKTSSDMVLSEHHQLHKLGWTGTGPDTGAEHADESPGHKLRLTYSSAYGDLQGIDLGLIRRPWPIVISLSRSMFDQDPAMSMLLEVGDS
jgi:hypothetical protein